MKKIFNDRGFLTKEGKAFVDDGFTKEVQKIFSTSVEAQDPLIIASILKSIIGELAFNKSQTLSQKSEKLKIVKQENKVIPFPVREN